MEQYFVEVYEDADTHLTGTYWYSDPDCTVRHRVDGPAVEWPNGDYLWLLDGKLHRTNGPAIQSESAQEWWLDGKRTTEAEHTRRTQPAQEMTVAQIEAALGHKIKIVK